MSNIWRRHTISIPRLITKMKSVITIPLLLILPQGGCVTGWITGLAHQDTTAIEFGKGSTERIPQGSDICPNSYPNSKITKIPSEAKA